MNAVGNLLPEDLVSLSDYERHARTLLLEGVWAYLNGAGAEGITRAANRKAFDALRLEGRAFADLEGAHTRIELFGIELSLPVLLAPVAYQKLAHPDGELATARGASVAKTVMCVSTQASTPLEDIAAVTQAPLFFQLYISRDRGLTRDLVRRAEAAGYRALMVTADAPVSGLRNEEARAGFAMPPGVEAVNLPPQARHQVGSPFVLMQNAPLWADVEWLRNETRLPLIVKGIMHPDDAACALDLGADAIAVSNHGGRVLDTLPATIETLPRIAERVAGRAPILLDGGVRRGTDIVKALALGAKAVMVGRPLVHALSVGGALGVAHMLALLRAELEHAMALTGCRTPDRITKSVLFSASGN